MLKLYVCTLFYKCCVKFHSDTVINKVAIQLLLTRLLPVATTKLAVEVTLV